MCSRPVPNAAALAWKARGVTVRGTASGSHSQATEGVGGLSTGGGGGGGLIREVSEGGQGAGRGGSGTQKFVYGKWPDKVVPIVNFAFSLYSHFGLEGRRRVQLRGGGLLLWCTAILIHSWVENGQSAPQKTWQLMTFLNPFNALIPKIPFSFFAEFQVWATSGARGSVSVGFWGGHQLSLLGGGGASQGALSTTVKKIVGGLHNH